VRYPGKASRIYTPSRNWQVEAYRHYGICGEARYAANYFGNALSKATLYAAEPDGDTLKRAATDSVAAQAMRNLFNGTEGQKQMLTAVGIHLTVAGECYLVGRTVQPNEEPETGIVVEEGGEVWEVVSTLEMNVSGKTWTIKYGSGMNDVTLADDAVVIRIWRPHPGKRIEADSPFRSLLPVLNEIEWMTKHIFSQARSRLAGAGILFMPQGMSFPTPPEDPDRPEAMNEADAFTLTLAEGMLEPLKGDGSPAEVVPLVVTAPDESIDKAKLMHFWSNLDEKALEMRKDAIHRFALGMDLPPEKIEGIGSNSGTGGGTSNGVSHWGAWQIDEDTIKLHVEPMLELVVNAVTIAYLRPATGGIEVVQYDTGPLRLRPDRSQEAIELWDRMAISTATMLREVGFDVGDEPDEAEIKSRILMKIASGSATPEQVAAAARMLGVNLPAGADGPPAAEATRPNPPPPSLEDHPTRPRTPAESPAALLAASDALVYRALERAGNRLRQTVVKPPACRAYETHTLIRANGTAEKVLEDAFSCGPEVLAGIADPERVIPVLESYCHTLLAEQSPHERDRLAGWLERQMS
jgi:hypothetical protein